MIIKGSKPLSSVFLQPETVTRLNLQNRPSYPDQDRTQDNGATIYLPVVALSQKPCVLGSKITGIRLLMPETRASAYVVMMALDMNDLLSIC